MDAEGVWLFVFEQVTTNTNLMQDNTNSANSIQHNNNMNTWTKTGK